MEDGGDVRKLRACMVCGLVRSFDQFREYGCPNCESFLRLRDSADMAADVTTNSFHGYVKPASSLFLLRLMGIVKGSGSWVARSRGIDRKVAGLYALSVQGSLPDDILARLELRGIRPIAHH